MYRLRFEPSTSSIQVWSDTDFIEMLVMMMMMMMMMMIFVRAREISPSHFVAQTIIIIMDGNVVRFGNGNSRNR
jgi:hypothetical protein